MPPGTAQDRDSELERIQTVEGAAPLAAAVAADALAHSLPGLNLLLAPASELFGATVSLWGALVRKREGLLCCAGAELCRVLMGEGKNCAVLQPRTAVDGRS